MHRREFIALLGSASLVASGAVRAQMPAKISRIAVVSPMGLMPAGNPYAKLLLDPLAGLGYRIGENLLFEGPSAPPGGAVPPEAIVAQLKDRKVDLIVAWGFPVVAAAKAAGIPTVVAF